MNLSPQWKVSIPRPMWRTTYGTFNLFRYISSQRIQKHSSTKPTNWTLVALRNIGRQSYAQNILHRIFTKSIHYFITQPCIAIYFYHQLILQHATVLTDLSQKYTKTTRYLETTVDLGTRTVYLSTFLSCLASYSYDKGSLALQTRIVLRIFQKSFLDLVIIDS